MDINDKDAGFYMAPVGGGILAGVAGAEAAGVGAIVDQLAHKDLRSGAIVIFGSAVLAATETIDLTDVKIMHSDDAGMAGAVEYTYMDGAQDHLLVATGATGGSTEAIAVKQRINLQGVKRYWQVSIEPACSAGSTDTYTFGFGVVAIGGEAPVA
jgi:hypothetical protein